KPSTRLSKGGSPSSHLERSRKMGSSVAQLIVERHEQDQLSEDRFGLHLNDALVAAAVLQFQVHAHPFAPTFPSDSDSAADPGALPDRIVGQRSRPVNTQKLVGAVAQDSYVMVLQTLEKRVQKRCTLALAILATAVVAGCGGSSDPTASAAACLRIVLDNQKPTSTCQYARTVTVS